MTCFLFQVQDHPGLRGTPLAMLAAQCNKLQTKTPPPLADAAVGKGFHPWKKCGQPSVEESSSVSKSGSNPNSPASVHSPAGHPNISHNNSSPAPVQHSLGYNERKSESHTMPCAEPSLALYPGYTPSSTPSHTPGPATPSLHHQKTDHTSPVSSTAAHLQLQQSMYSRVAGMSPYESWPFGMTPGSAAAQPFERWRDGFWQQPDDVE